MPHDGEHPNLRPRDAATLIIVRKTSKGAQVLMGERNSKHVFFPNHYVFPGGSVDRGDGFATVAAPLRHEVAAALEEFATPHRAKALALAAVRETFEEVGLIVGEKRTSSMPKRPSKDWKAFYETGYAPALDGLTYIQRAVTPPRRPRRFDARFFAIDADRIVGDMADGAGGDGELLKIRWFTFDDAMNLKIRPVTIRAIREIELRLRHGTLDDPRHPIPWFKTANGKRIEGVHGSDTVTTSSGA